MTTHHIALYPHNIDGNNPDEEERYKAQTIMTNTYTIRVKGHLAQHVAGRFEGMTISLTEDGETLIVGDVIDQAALHSLLRTIRDMGLELVSVNQSDETN